MPKGIYISICSDGVGRRKGPDFIIIPTANLTRRSLLKRRMDFCLASAKTLTKDHNPFIFSIAILVLLTILSVFPMPFYNGGANAGPGTSNPSTTSITLSTSATGTSVSLIPGANFKLSEVADTAAFDVITDNFTGYNIKLVAADDAQTLVNTVDNTKVIDSITAPILETNFVRSNPSLINRWGIKPNKYYDATSSSTITNTTTILPGPNSTGTMLDITNAANSTANNYSIAIGAMVDGDIPSGTYIRETTLVATSNPIYYTVTYDKNTDDTVTDLPAADSGSTTATKITINSTPPSRAHYAFTGWCLGVTDTVDGVDSCYTDDGTGHPTTTPGKVFNPGADFGIDQTTANITTLYAMWRIDTVTVSLTAGTGIDTVAITGSGVKTGGTAGSTSTAEVYYNGEITITAIPAASYVFDNWTGDATYTNNPETISNVTADLALTANTTRLDAIQNLSASACTTTGPKQVYDTRDNQVYTIQRLADGNCWMTQNLKLGKTTETLTLTGADSDVPSFTLNGKSSDGKFESKTIGGVSDVNDSSQYYCTEAYGCYYNWHTATGGSGSSATTSGDANYSICPAGWTLPTRQQYSSFITYYNTSASILVNPTSATENINGASAPGLLLGGFYMNTGGSGQGARSIYWSRSASSARDAIAVFVDPAISVAHGRKYTGVPVRCILDSSVQAMQNISASTIDSLVPTTGSSTTLKDTRDGQKYTVTKLTDGTIWMTQDLRFTGTELTPADSNVESNITLTYGADLSTGDSVTEPRIHNTDTAAHGVWYNYTAASAGTVNTSADGNDATQSICPAGWRLPTQTEINAVVSNSTGFNPSTGGVWATKSLQYTGWGMWWSATANGTTNRYRLDYNSAGSGNKFSSNLYDRLRGVFVRCVYDRTQNMQNISYDNLNSLVPNTGDSTTLKDTRDGQRYTVAKLADGNVWMIDNLNLGAVNFTEKLTSANTNITGEINASTFLGWKVSSGSYNDYSKYEFIPVDGSDSTSLTKYGTLYNYRVATAGTIYGDKNTNDATQDICPAGWRLPTGGSSGEFQGLKTAYSTLANLQAPVASGGAAFARAGNFTNTPTYQGQRATYLSSTRGSDTATAGFGLVNGAISNPYNLDRRAGHAIRCIYDKSATMQNFSVAEANAMTVGETKTLTDSRDNQDYTVTKLPDGNVWMTRNLAIGCDGKGSNYGANNVATALTSADSDVVTSFTTPTTKANTTASSTVAKQLCDSTYGAYYNYAAASANDIKTASTEVEAQASICPKGWRLPTWAEQTAITGYVSQFNPVVGGYTNGGNPGYTTYGFWWSSTANGTANRHVLRYYNGSMNNSASNEGRGLAFYVRCIKKDDRTIANIDNMQDITPGIVANTADNTTKVLKDTRDNQTYNVTKINGQLWMTDNLRLGRDDTNPDTTTIELTPADSNVNENRTITAYDLVTYGDSGANGYCYGDTNGGKGFSNPCIHSKDTTSGNDTIGVWYNYVAATAGTITGNSNSTDATESICPKGWQLPSHADNQALVSAIGSSPTVFNPVYGGDYANGALNLGTTRGFWWAATAYNNQRHHYLVYGSNLTASANLRHMGVYVRCVAK